MKIIAFYLPQFHVIPENEIWWGKGFTEWTNVKRAKPLYEGHKQPRIPLNNNYYDLLNVSVMEWQAKLASEHGVYGFCFYHYWFSGKLLLEKPLENYLAAKHIKLRYCICWANENWTTQWISDKSKTLIHQDYGNDTEWKAHYNYLSQFFHDDRYIRMDGKPILIIYRPELIDNYQQMICKLNEYAQADGFPGLCMMCQKSEKLLDGDSSIADQFDYSIEYQPYYAFSATRKKHQKLESLRALKRKILLFIEKKTKLSTDSWNLSRISNSLKKYDYDEVWKTIINMKPLANNSIPGAFVNWDNTPRKGIRGSVTVGFSVEKFEMYLSMQVKHAIKDYHQDMLFLFAWNEWGEGGYIEPDTYFHYACLEAIKRTIYDEKN